MFQVFPRVQAHFPAPRCQVTTKNNGQRVETGKSNVNEMEPTQLNLT